MKLKLNSVFNENIILKISILFFIISIASFTLLWLDSKTSIYASDYEIEYVCNSVDGIGDAHEELIKSIDTNIKYAQELKHDYKWVNVELVNKHFKFRGDIMRLELYKTALIAAILINSISFFAITFIFSYKRYKHETIVKGLENAIKTIKK